jgi:hypothetical protein
MHLTLPREYVGRNQSDISTLTLDAALGCREGQFKKFPRRPSLSAKLKDEVDRVVDLKNAESSEAISRVTNIATDLQHDEFGLFGSKAVHYRFVAQAVLLLGTAMRGGSICGRTFQPAYCRNSGT